MDKVIALGDVTLGEGVDTWNTIIFLYNSALKEVQTKVEILNDENTSSPEVGYLCGFSTPKYFRDVFRKYVGCTPKEYREAARNHSKWPETQ